MAINWDIYAQHSNMVGKTSRDSIIRQTRDSSADLCPNSHAYRECKIGENTVFLAVLNGVNLTEKIVKTMPNQNLDFKLGDIISFANCMWLVILVDADDEIMRSGKMRQCNQLFKFQNHSSQILQCWGIVENPYSRLSSEGKILSEPYNQLKFYLPFNDDTARLFIDKRLAISKGFDKNGDQIPIVYAILDINNTASNYGNGSVLDIMVKRTLCTEDDNLEFLIADYIKPSHILPPSPEKLKCCIAGPSFIRSGGFKKSYTPIFYSSQGIADANIQSLWEVIMPSGFEDLLTLHTDPNSLTISIAQNDDILGEFLTINLTDQENLYNLASIKVEITGIYG